VKGIRERLEGMKDEASAQAYLESVQNAVVDVKEAGENAVKEVTRKVTRDNASEDLLGSALDKYFDEDVVNAIEELEKQLKAPELKALEEKLKAALEGAAAETRRARPPPATRSMLRPYTGTSPTLET